MKSESVLRAMEIFLEYPNLLNKTRMEDTCLHSLCSECLYGTRGNYITTCKMSIDDNGYHNLRPFNLRSIGQAEAYRYCVIMMAKIEAEEENGKNR